MKILITGSRDWTNMDVMARELLKYEGSEPPIILAHGDARGADKMAGKMAEELGWAVLAYPVDTAVDGPWPAAGHHRNRRMFNDFQPDLVLAFPLLQSRGTIGMVDYAKEKGCLVREIRL